MVSDDDDDDDDDIRLLLTKLTSWHTTSQEQILRFADLTYLKSTNL